jgi:hypothetical protein
MVFNKLTTFPREVYEDILEEMLIGSGSFNIYGSMSYLIIDLLRFLTSLFYPLFFSDPMTCDDCHLGWLINEKRYLLTRVSDGMCANGTSFDQLDSQVYGARCVKDNAAAPNKAPPLLLILILTVIGFLLV